MQKDVYLNRNEDEWSWSFFEQRKSRNISRGLFIFILFLIPLAVLII